MPQFYKINNVSIIWPTPAFWLEISHCVRNDKNPLVGNGKKQGGFAALLFPVLL